MMQAFIIEMKKTHMKKKKKKKLMRSSRLRDSTSDTPIFLSSSKKSKSWFNAAAEMQSQREDAVKSLV